jgi:hypothetical protein
MTLGSDRALGVEPGLRQLIGELLGTVEVRGREPTRMSLGIAVLTVGEVALHDRFEAGLGEKPCCRPS